MKTKTATVALTMSEVYELLELVYKAREPAREVIEEPRCTILSSLEDKLHAANVRIG